jgi:hypothetical protein
MKYISIKKLEKTSYQLASAVVEVRSWSTIMSYNLNKKKDYNLQSLYEEAQKIEDFGKQLQESLFFRIGRVKEHTKDVADCSEGISSMQITGGVI